MATTIRIENPEPWITDLYAQDGGVYLDTDEDLEIRLSKSLEELTEAAKIAREASLSGSVPQTKKNQAILSRYATNAWKRKNRAFSLKIEATHKGQRLDTTRLQVVRTSDRERNYEIELFGGAWIDDLERCALNELDLGTFTYTLANVLAAWADQTALAVPVLADHGGWWEPGTTSRRDCRFRFNLYKLLQAAFCQATDYRFSSPYLESQAGASLYAYLSPLNWHSYREKNDQFRVALDIPAPLAMTGNPESDFWSEVYDPFDLWNNILRPFQYIYPPLGDDELAITFTLELTVTLPANSPAGTFYIVFYKNQPGAGAFDTIFFETVQGSATEEITRTISVDFRDEEATNNGMSYGTIVGYQQQDGPEEPFNYYDYTIQSGMLDIRPDPPYYIEDDVINLADLLDPDINCLDLFRAAVHIFNGKLQTSTGARTVTAYPPFDTEQLGEAVQGFLQRSQGHATLEVLSNSRVAADTERDQDRYVKLKWADAQDAFIREFRKGDLYSRTIDLGFGKSETTDIENPIFEPTVERKTEPEETGGTGVYLPILNDNLDGNRSRDIGPRIGWHYGLVQQQDGTGELTIEFEGGVRGTFGYITQNPTVSRTNDAPNVPLIFAEHQFDLWRLFYRQWLSEQSTPLQFEFLAVLDLQGYRALDFRKPIGVFYAETFLLYQLQEVRDFDIEGRTSTPVKMRRIEC